MKRTYLFLVFVLGLSLVLGGCLGKKTAEQAAAPGVIDTLQGAKNATDLGKALQEGNDKDAQKAIENLANMGAKMEENEFDKTQAVDKPDKFPSDLVYSDGKITEAEDSSSSDEDLNLSITIKTKDELNKAKDFYKKLLAENGWKITSQSAKADSASFDAKHEASNATTDVSINRPQYSNLTEISINYYKSPM